MGKKIGVCPICGKDFEESKFGWGCTGWQDGCKTNVYGEIAGRKISEAEATALINGQTIGPLKGFKSKAGKPFETKLKFDKGSGKVVFVFEDNSTPTNISCPKCGKNLSVDSAAYRCECGFKIYKTIAQKTLTEAEVKELCQNGHTGKLSGFVSKKGNNFDAYLVLGDEGVEFSFDEPATSSAPVNADNNANDSETDEYEDYEDDLPFSTDDFD